MPQYAPVRAVLNDLLSQDECRELVFIQTSLAACGYAPHILSTKLSDITYAAPELLVPLVAARDNIAAAAEALLGCDLGEVAIEFTGLVSWTTGACLDWHFDSNRDYLKQRFASAVVYLNQHDQDFSGGLLEFAKGQPAAVVPRAGSMVVFHSDESNVHRVTEITCGERHTLTLWFTKESAHVEDYRIISQLQQSGCKGKARPDALFQADARDVRLERMHAAGLSARQQAAGAVTLQRLPKGWRRTVWDGDADGVEAVQFGSLQDALLTVMYAQWQPPALGGDKLQSLEAAAERLAAYLAELRGRLLTSWGDWCSAGQLYAA